MCEYLILLGFQPGSTPYWYIALCFPVFPLVAGLRCLRTASAQVGRKRRAWACIALGCFCIAAAEAFWGYLEFFLLEASAMTVWVTMGYVFSPVFFVVGMLLYRDRSQVAGVSLVQAGNLGIVFSSVLFAYILIVYQILLNVYGGSEGAIVKTFQGAIIMAAAVTGLTLVSLHFRGQKRAIMSLIVIGMLCIVIEYFSFIYFLVNDLFTWTNPYSGLYLIASTSLFFAAWEQQQLAPETRDLEANAALEERAKQWETLLPAVAVAGVFVVAILFRGGLSRELLPYLSGTLLVLVSSLGVRNWWAQRVEARLNQQLQDQAEDLSEARDAAQASDVAKSRFLSWVSHETRTPLSGILGFTELLEDRHFGELNERQAGFVQHIRESGDHLLELINDLLDVTQITMGAVTLSVEDVSPADVVLEVVQNVELGSREKGISVVNEVGPDAPLLRADRRRLRQSLYNLLSNALKFTPAGGGVGIRWSLVPGGRLCIEVWDQGIGIAATDLESIFDEFYQVDRKRDELLGGSGIGLTLTRRLADLHGGEVRVESELGRGSSFFLVLPLASQQPGPDTDRVPQERHSEKPAQHVFDSATRVLVVDNDPANLAVIQGLLEVRGIVPIAARGGWEAVGLVGEARPQLVLMDIHMPDCDGFDALAQIRAHESLASIPVVAMTASASESDQARYIEAGFDAFLSKPIDSIKLDAQLNRFMSPSARRAPPPGVDPVQDPF
ncbi:MAG: ATP-binding protein [Myxococcota bacterium]